MSGNGGRTGKLRVAMHTAHGVSQAIRGGAGSHVVRMQRAPGTAAGSNREIFYAVLTSPLLIGTSNQVLEAGRIGRVAGDGNVDFLFFS